MIASEQRDMKIEGCRITAITRIDLKDLKGGEDDIDAEIIRALEVYTGTCNSICSDDELYVGVAFQWQDNNDEPYWFIIDENGDYDDIEKKQFDKYVTELKKF